MPEINFKTTQESFLILEKICKQIENISGEAIPRNIIARIGFMYSIGKGKKFKLNNYGRFRSDGKEFKDSIFFLNNGRKIMIALLQNHYERRFTKAEEGLGQLIKMHVDDGLTQLAKDQGKEDIFIFLNSIIKRPLNSNRNIYNKNLLHGAQKNLSSFDEILNIDIADNLTLYINDARLHSNFHTFIAGKPGSSKSFFVQKILLNQFAKNSQNRLKFLYLDYKGAQSPEVLKIHMPDVLDLKFVDLKQNSIPFNPLRCIDISNKKKKKEGIANLVDALSNLSRLNVKQKNRMHTLIEETFNANPNAYPTLQDVFNNLEDDEEGNLCMLLNSIKDQFEDSQNLSALLQQNSYFKISQNISEQTKLTSVYLFLSHLFSLIMSLNKTQSNVQVKPIRFMLVIDEAHIIIINPILKKLIQKMLCQLVSQGVGIIFIAQDLANFIENGGDLIGQIENFFIYDIQTSQTQYQNLFNTSKLIPIPDKGEMLIKIKELQNQTKKEFSTIKIY